MIKRIIPMLLAAFDIRMLVNVYENRQALLLDAYKIRKGKNFFASFFHIRQFYDKIRKKTKKQVLI